MKITPHSALGKKLLAKGLVKPEQLVGQDPPYRKWRNKPTRDSHGVLHPSKLQAQVMDRLRRECLSVICEVSMPLSERPRDRIRVDALVILQALPDGEFVGKFVEVKGVDLGEGKQKRRRFEDRYGVPIEVIQK